MQRDPRQYLWDVELSITEIMRYTNGRNFAEYSTESFVRDAVERRFEIIGEALVRLARHFPAEIEQIQNYRQFIGFRNVLAHQYDGIDDVLVWKAIESSLSTLKDQVVAMRQALDGYDPLQ